MRFIKLNYLRWIIGYYVPNDGFRVRFYSAEDAYCPDEIKSWVQITRIKKFKFKAKIISLGNSPIKGTRLKFQELIIFRG